MMNEASFTVVGRRLKTPAMVSAESIHLKGGNVRFGSKADIGAPPINVRFTPKSGHRNSLTGCPLCATSGHMHCSNRDLLGEVLTNFCQQLAWAAVSIK